ncbi:MAG: hypothetical protein WBC85_10415 [Planktotalea sp.]|uniref:hypothetical protein n=1 Tax=Planktotalea sp. TaxID=2029877 RepID=UPI003C7722CD
MKKMIVLMAGVTAMLSGCVETTGTSASAPTQFISEVPEGVLSIAAAGQDLSALKIDPVDGCYTYRHVGPVETTMLPLRASNGRPICTRAAS